MYTLEVKNIEKTFSAEKPLKSVNLNLASGEIGCLVGPSGCGKSTLLRIISGLETAERGSVKINNRMVFDKNINIPPFKRNVGMIFQDFSLFSHMNVFENVAFSIKKGSKATIKKKVYSILECFQISDIKFKYPHELSGGQQQRVALARTFIKNPDILLMDEPFSNLDVSLKDKLLKEIKSIIKSYQTTTLMVTHSMEEALKMSDKVGILKNGEIIQWASPYAIYHRPVDKFTADFSGDTSYIHARLINGVLETGLGKFDFNDKKYSDGEYDLLIRPEDITVSSEGIDAKVLNKEFMGAYTNYQIKLSSDDKILIKLPSHLNFSIGTNINVTPDFKHFIMFPSEKT